jgi:hypothetical protein
MAFSFVNADVLHLDPEWEGQECRARKFLLWPAFAYRVLAPEPRRRSLNLLQRHVLNLCRAGVTRPRDIADLLDLHPHLAASILEDLHGRGILDADNRLTRSGTEAVEEDRADRPKMAVTHVFQDPWTEQFWHRLAEQLGRIEAPPRGQSYHLLRLGTHGKPVRELALAVRPPKDLPRPNPPTAEQVVEEARLDHQARIDHLRLTGREEADDEGESFEDARLIDRVTLIEPDPLPVLLTTLVYVPPAGEGDVLWQARDPFGLGTNPWLREAIRDRAEEIDALKALLGELRGAEAPAKADGVQADPRQMQLEAEALIEDRLGIALRHDYPALFTQLVKMAYPLLRVEKVGRTAPAGDLEDVIAKANNVLERLFEELRQLFPTDRCYEGHGLMPDDKNNNAATLRGVARKVGFELGEERELDGLFRRDLKGIRTAADTRRGAIAPRVVATLLKAHRTPDHPFWEAARYYPDLLRRIMRLADLRNQAAAHAGGAEVEYDQIPDHIETVYRTVSALLLGPRPGRRPAAGPTGPEQGGGGVHEQDLARG